ncbi:MAG: hypothetical protein KF691_01440 [Phycisphaeraceae bacterium]|nr:hypothetical protein [Phycisphaeraceae bacterium]
MRGKCLIAAFMLISQGTLGADTPATSSFTYQGVLKVSGAPASGMYDLQFSLWDAPVGGVQIGSTVTKAGVTVLAGQFTTSIDFGSQYPSAKRYLQIAASPAGANTYSLIVPRQELTATPLASGLVLPWTATTTAATGITLTAQLAPLWGTATNGFGIGVYGQNTSSASGAIGVKGSCNAGLGVYGEGGAYGGRFSALASNATGVWGQGGTEGIGVGGTGMTAVRGDSSFGGTGSYGVYGLSHSTNGTGVYGEASAGSVAYGIWGRSTSGYAGYFGGNVSIAGTLTKSGGSFRIDHPLDPEHKYLSHSFVESPDMMNIYNGNIVTDERGYATVRMPDWFDALNREFRYQLTVLDSLDSDEFVQAKVVREMREGCFSIRTSRGSTAVSWQVTGIRRDAWAEAHRIQVEQWKEGAEAGRYLHPELFGAPASRAMDAKR